MIDLRRFALEVRFEGQVERGRGQYLKAVYSALKVSAILWLQYAIKIDKLQLRRSNIKQGVSYILGYQEPSRF